MTCQRSPGRKGYMCLRLPVYVKIEWTLHNMVSQIGKIIGKMRVRTFLCDVHMQGHFTLFMRFLRVGLMKCVCTERRSSGRALRWWLTWVPDGGISFLSYIQQSHWACQYETLSTPPPPPSTPPDTHCCSNSSAIPPIMGNPGFELIWPSKLLPPRVKRRAPRYG